MKGKYDDHYKNLSPQPIEVIENWGLDFHLANVLKYIARAGKKEGESELKDLEKAKVYLERKILKLNEKRDSDWIDYQNDMEEIVDKGMTIKQLEKYLDAKIIPSRPDHHLTTDDNDNARSYKVGQVWTCVNNPKYTLTIKAIHNNGRMLVCINDGGAEVKHVYFSENGKPAAGAPEDVFSNFQLTVLKTEA